MHTAGQFAECLINVFANQKGKGILARPPGKMCQNFGGCTIAHRLSNDQTLVRRRFLANVNINISISLNDCKCKHAFSFLVL